MSSISIGVDIGGSHISCAACDLADRKYLPETFAENKVNNQAGAGEIIEIWADTIQQTVQRLDAEAIAGIGFAMPGPFDYVSGVALFDHNVRKYESLYGINIPEILREKLHLHNNFPVRFVNDATAFALGEDWIGKAGGTSRSLAVTLGTGFGSAFLENHLPVVSGETVPEKGYVYHLPFESGIADDYFSTRGLLARFQEKTGKRFSGVRELAELAASETAVVQLFADFGFKLGVFLAPLIEKFGAEVLVVGGNISNAFPLFGQYLQNYFLRNGICIPIEESELNETASIIGSALLADDEFYRQLLPRIKLV